MPGKEKKNPRGEEEEEEEIILYLRVRARTRVYMCVHTAARGLL